MLFQPSANENVYARSRYQTRNDNVRACMRISEKLWTRWWRRKQYAKFKSNFIYNILVFISIYIIAACLQQKIGANARTELAIYLSERIFVYEIFEKTFVRAIQWCIIREKIVLRKLGIPCACDLLS